MDTAPYETLTIPNEVQAELLAISEQRDEAIREFDELSSERLEKKHQIENLSDRQNELLRKVRSGETTSLFDSTGQTDQDDTWQSPSPVYEIGVDEGADAELEATEGH